MRFADDSLHPEKMAPLIITAAPYGPAWLPGDATDIAVTWDEQVQAADWDLYLRLSERVDTVGDIRLPMVAGWVYIHHYVQATRRGERAPFTCTHPKLAVQEKWEETALRRLFFDPPLLLAPPKLHQTPVEYLLTRARRAVKDGHRALSLMHMRLFGFPGAKTLLNQVDKEALRTEVIR